MIPFRLRFSAALCAAVLLASVSGCGGKKSGDKDGKGGTSLFKKATQKTAVVGTYTVSSKEVPLVITEDGKSEASDRYQAKAPANVKVQRVFVEEGARVQPGDPLVKFNDETISLRLNLARAEVREAEVGLSAYGQAEPRREAPQPGAQPGQPQEDEGSSQDVVPNEARSQLFQAQLERARAEIELYEKMTELEQLNSPIAGIVGRHDVSEGSDAAEDQTLIEIVKLDPIYFVFNIAPDQVSYVERGGEIVIKFAAMPGQEFAGEVASIGSEAGNSGNGGVEVKMRIPNPDLALKADLKGSVEIRTAARRRVVTVPESAIVRSDRSAYVYKVTGNKVDRVAVDVGTSNGGSQVEIEKGLVDGDTIVISAEGGMESLTDGAAVDVQTAGVENAPTE